jgi:hypothetical protein
MSEILADRGEYLDTDFSPSIRQLGWVSHRNFLRTWNFNLHGVPGPTFTGDSAAYWLASKRTKHNEVPVLAATKKPSELDISTSSKSWYAGIIGVDYIELLSDNPIDLHRACLEVAISGPNYFNHVIEYFNNLIPLEPIDLPETVEQFKTLVI